jgi:methylmalonyl-CoA mutase, C-terminal domain
MRCTSVIARSNKVMRQSPGKRRRVLIAKIGLDGHDRGVKIVAQGLRDAGVEVIYLGIHNTPADIVNSAMQEDVDMIGLSIHSAAHKTLLRDLTTLLEKNAMRNVVVFVGGIIPRDDVKFLERLGIKGVFPPGTPLEEIVRFVEGSEKDSGISPGRVTGR